MSEQEVQLIAALPVAVMLIGADERIRAASPAAQVLLGQEIVGRSLATVVRHPVFLEGLDRVLRGDAEARARLTLASKAGRDMNLLFHVARIGQGPTTKVLVTFEDMTALDSAEAMRRDFVANVSHELRTPLTALMGFIETLKGAARDDRVARGRFLDIMEREASRMIRLVNDLLSLSRVEAQERRRPDEPVELVGLTRSVIAAMRPQTDGAGVVLALESELAAATIAGDPDQLAQVIQNLVENAVKYAASGKRVDIHISHVAREPLLAGPAIRLEVRDHGEGIEPMHLPRLTERFYRVDTHRSREQGGTGLGLAIVKHIVNRHRGRFKIESTVGKGSTFSVILPMP